MIFLRNTCWDRIEGSKIYAYEYSQLTFDKGTKTVFSTSGARAIGYLYAKKLSRHRLHSSHTHKKKLKMDHRPKCKTQKTGKFL